MTNACWNEVEDERLQGLPWASQILYLRGLRRRMDFRAGTVGVGKHKISWQTFHEVLYVDHHQGISEITLNKKQLKRALQWLVKAGMVEVRTEGRYLQFFLPLADTDSSAQKKADPRPTHVRPIKATPCADDITTEYSSDLTASNTESRPTSDPSENEKAALHPVSGIPIKDIKASTRAAPLVERENSAKRPTLGKNTMRSLLPPTLVRDSERTKLPADNRSAEALAEPQAATPTRKPRGTASTGAPAPSSATWAAYSVAYRERYHVDPIRNAAVNGQLAHLVARLGAQEAPLVAAYYLTRNDRWYVDCGHSTDALLRHWQKLRTEWVTTQTPNLQACGDQARIPNRPAVVRL